jgi:tRNA(Arg) A34 adenosine deaminase TadA
MSTISVPPITLQAPSWLEGFLKVRHSTCSSMTERMELVIELSRLNVEHGTGGPFSAGIFDMDTNLLLAPGVNMVVESGCSIAHAEVMAIITAQKLLGHYDLGSAGNGRYELVSSAEPCAMCQGAIVWSGVRSLVCGARGRDAEDIGFDEGPKPADWLEQFEKRGITVTTDVCREEAVRVLREYRDNGGVIYNAGRCEER